MLWRNICYTAFAGLSLLLASCASGPPEAQRREALAIPWPPESLASEWKVGRDERGGLTATCAWRYGATDRRLTIVVPRGARSPASGSERFANGYVKAMSPEALQLFWEFGGARHAVERGASR